MDKVKDKAKIASIILTVVLILNLVLFIPRKVDPLIFWAVIFVCALFAWKILPKLRK